MNEAEYIAATNLIRVRIAKDAMRHLDFSPEIPERELTQIFERLNRWEAALVARFESDD